MQIVKGVSSADSAQALFLALSACVLPLRKGVRRLAPFVKVVSSTLSANLASKIPEEFAQNILGKDHPGAKASTSKRYGPVNKHGDAKSKKASLLKETPGVAILPFLKCVLRKLKKEAADKVGKT